MVLIKLSSIGNVSKTIAILPASSTLLAIELKPRSLHILKAICVKWHIPNDLKWLLYILFLAILYFHIVHLTDHRNAFFVLKLYMVNLKKEIVLKIMKS